MPVVPVKVPVHCFGKSLFKGYLVHIMPVMPIVPVHFIKSF